MSSRIPTMIQPKKSLNKPAEKPVVVKKTSVLTIGARMTLVEQRLTNMEQEDEWWIEWKQNRPILPPNIAASSLNQQDHDSINNHPSEDILKNPTKSSTDEVF